MVDESRGSPKFSRSLLEDAAERSIRYLEGVNGRPVFPQPEDVARLESALSGSMPEDPVDPAQVLSLMDEFGSPATVASAGGRYFGFVIGGALPATVAANWLAGAWDQNSFGFNSSPAGALFDETGVRWLRDVLRLPDGAEGALVSGATLANFTCLAAARDEVLRQHGWDVGSQGLFGAPEITVVLGEEVHSTVSKVLALLGLGRDRVVRVPVDGEGRIRSDALPAFDGPTIVCLQAGNVNSGAFDPAREVIPKVKSCGGWVHVDGAFGLWARASRKHSHLADGFDLADSWATDAHKWLNVPYDCGAAFVRSPEALRRAMSTSGAYLLLSGRRDAIDVTPGGSRRARGIETWAALQSLGRSGLEALIDGNCAQARWLAERLRESGLEVMNEVVLNQVVVSFGNDERTRRALKTLQAAGECWCGGTDWHGRHAMRVSISSWATTQADMERTLAAILAADH